MTNKEFLYLFGTSNTAQHRMALQLYNRRQLAKCGICTSVANCEVCLERVVVYSEIANKIILPRRGLPSKLRSTINQHELNGVVFPWLGQED